MSPTLQTAYKTKKSNGRKAELKIHHYSDKWTWRGSIEILGKKLAQFSKKTQVSLEALSFLNKEFLHYHNTYFFYFIANSHIILNTSGLESYFKIPIYFHKRFLLRLLLEKCARQARHIAHAVTAPAGLFPRSPGHLEVPSHSPRVGSAEPVSHTAPASLSPNCPVYNDLLEK